MAGIIVGYDDVIANIPSGWNQCDGNSGRPNLFDKYIKSVGASEDPGATGGAATHTHTSPAHNHTQDGHTHETTSAASTSTPNWFCELYPGSVSRIGHTHYLPLDSTTPTNQNATVTLDTTSTDPPYYKLAFIYDSGSNKYPANAVILWNSATLPNGWSLHTGLKNAFAKSTGSAENPGGTGGSSTSHTHTNTAHNHTQNAHTHTCTHGGTSIKRNVGTTSSSSSVSNATHTHTITPSSVVATNQTSSVTITNADGQPVYYKLSYIKNTGVANRPKNGIVNWTGTIASIPTGYAASGILNSFIKGANDSSELGNTGGSATHSHSASSHNHTQDSHTHSITIGAGSGTLDIQQGPESDPDLVAHTHTSPSVSGTNTNQAATITTDSANSEPPYYKAAFITQTITMDVGAYAFILS